MYRSTLVLVITPNNKGRHWDRSKRSLSQEITSRNKKKHFTDIINYTFWQKNGLGKKNAQWGLGELLILCAIAEHLVKLEVSLSLGPKTGSQYEYIYPIPRIIAIVRKELSCSSRSFQLSYRFSVCIRYIQYINVISDCWDLGGNWALCKNKALNNRWYSIWVEPEAESWFVFAHWLCYNAQKEARQKKKKYFISELFYFTSQLNKNGKANFLIFNVCDSFKFLKKLIMPSLPWIKDYFCPWWKQLCCQLFLFRHAWSFLMGKIHLSDIFK